jgi:hypothetical protein
METKPAGLLCAIFTVLPSGLPTATLIGRYNPATIAVATTTNVLLIPASFLVLML